MSRERGHRLGVDVGGTFTDLVLAAPDGRALTRKILSSTANYAEAIIDTTLSLLATLTTVDELDQIWSKQ